MIQCDHCDKRFKNRKNFLSHLHTFHNIAAAVRRVIRIGKKEGKPLRKVRMMANAMRMKKDRDRVSKVSSIARKRQVERGVRK